MAKWPQGAMPCLPLSGIHRPPCRGRHRYAGFEGCRTLSEWSYRPLGKRQKVSLILSVKHGQRSASEKKNEPYFLMAARKVCSIRSMGCCLQRLWWNVRPISLAALEWRASLLLGSFAVFCWIHSFCRAWRKLGERGCVNIDILMYDNIDVYTLILKYRYKVRST